LKYIAGTLSRIHRLRTTDRIFFVTVKLCRSLPAFGAPEYPMMIGVLESSRRRLRKEVRRCPIQIDDVRLPEGYRG